MNYQDNLTNQTLLKPEDFDGEVLYAFDYLPENNRLNREILARAYARAIKREQDSNATLVHQ